jgi:hypothetical protein
LRLCGCISLLFFLSYNHRKMIIIVR